MKFESTKEKLLEAVQIADRVSGNNHSLEVLNNILLSTIDGSSLIIKATNLDVGVEISVAGKVLESGEIAIPGSILVSVLQSVFDSSNISFTIKDNNLVVKTINGTSTIKAVPHTDFPKIPKPKSLYTLSIQPKEFITGIKAVSFSASNSTIKPELASVYVYGDTNTLTFVATDSFRLAEKVVSTKKVGDFESLLLPVRNIQEIVRVLEHSEDQEIAILFSEQQISFSANSVYMTSRVLDGEFPDYKQIIPKKFTTEVVLLKYDFLNILKKSNIFSDKFNQTTFTINQKNKNFSIKTISQDVGETIDTVPASLTGEDITISFNLKYLTDTLQSITTDSISLSFAGSGKPLLIRPVGDQTYQYLVMPMNR